MTTKEGGLRGSIRNVGSLTPAFFQIDITSTNSPVTEGDTLEVDYLVDNTGDKRDIQDVYLEIDSVEEDRDSNIELFGGSNASGTLFWDTTGENATDYTASVFTDDDSDTVTVTVEGAIPDSGNLQANYDARELSSATTFTDQSGNGYDLSAIGSPSLVTDGINGRQAVSYAAADGHSIGSTNWDSLAQPNTIYVVYEYDGGGTGERRIIDRATSSGERHLIEADRSGQLGMWAGNNFVEGGTTTQDPDIVTGVFNGSSSELYQDDTSVANGDVGAEAMDSLGVAEREDGSANQYSGLIGHILIYDAAHDSTTQQEVYNYLQNEWFGATDGGLSLEGQIQDTTNLDGAHSTDKKGDYVYVVAFNSDTINAIDVSDPSNPTIADTLSPAGLDIPSSGDADPTRDYAYFGGQGDGNFYVVNIADPANLSVETTVQEDTLRSVKMLDNDHVAVWDNGTNDVIVYDVTTPTAPTEADRLNIPAADGGTRMDTQGDYLYLAVSTPGDGLWIIDKTTPTNLSVTGSVSGTELSLNNAISVHDESVAHNAVAENGTGSYTSVDISDKSNPTISGDLISTPETERAEGVASRNSGGTDYAYICAEQGDSFTVVNVSDPVNPTIEDTIQDTTYLNEAKDVVVEGSLAYVSSSGGAFAVINGVP